MWSEPNDVSPNLFRHDEKPVAGVESIPGQKVVHAGRLVRSDIVTDEDDSSRTALFHGTNHRPVCRRKERHPMINQNKIRSLAGQPLATISPTDGIDRTEKLFTGNAVHQSSIVFLGSTWKQQGWVLIAKRED